ncbi:hypothetical protein BC332_14367 [Capsicum chinense]|nr:hypothetical protein BC332_14367 [Capsicum chinense]
MEETSVAMAWISFPTLPPHYFVKEALFSLASSVGKPLQVDLATKNKMPPSCARGHDEEGCRVLHPEHISNDKKQEDGDSVEQTDQHAAVGHIDQNLIERQGCWEYSKYLAMENGDGENNKLEKVPYEIVAAEAGHTTNASNVDKNLNANAPMFNPRNTTGSPAKEKSTKECVTSAFSKENGGQLVMG